MICRGVEAIKLNKADLILGLGFWRKTLGKIGGKTLKDFHLFVHRKILNFVWLAAGKFYKYKKIIKKKKSQDL